jgi:uncharacterized protein
MSESIIRSSVSSRRKQEDPKKKKIKKIVQIILGVAVFAAICVLAAIAQQTSGRGAFVLFIGVLLGYILQRSRFCFTASLRDPLLTGGTNLTKAVIIALAVASVIFMAINMKTFGLGLENYDLTKVAGNVKSVGIHTMIGAFLFGIGAVIAGGCASGTLMRMGEGFIQQWLVIVFFIIGSIFGLSLASMITPQNAPVVFLPKLVGGWIPAILIHFGLLLVLYILADIWGRKKAKG